MASDSESDAPEELTQEQGIRQDEEIRKVQRENRTRVTQEGKQKRRQWAQRRISEKPNNEDVSDVPETEEQEDALNIPGMLPKNVLDFLATREKQVFSSDSEEETMPCKPRTKRKKQKFSGPETVLLNGIPPAHCLQNSLEFLQRRKTQVARSPAVLKNARQAFRFLSSRGSLLGKI